MRVLSESSCVFCKFCYNCEIIATISTYQECNKDKTYIVVASYVRTASYNSHHSSLVAADVDYIMPNAYLNLCIR